MPGVIVTGSVPIEGGSSTLSVSGKSAAHGTLTYHPGGTITGTLDGHKVRTHVAARAARSVTQALPVRLPRYRRLLQLG